MQFGLRNKFNNLLANYRRKRKAFKHYHTFIFIMAKENHTYQIISAILLIAVISFAGLYFTKSAPSQEINEKTCSDFINECPEIPEEKAILDSQSYTWGINFYDESEFLFNYWLHNYGNVEGKNVKVRCKLYNEEQGIVFSGLHDFGNIASVSSTFGEFTPSKSTAQSYNSNKEYSGYCYVESCDNCEILYKRIPDLVETFED